MIQIAALVIVGMVFYAVELARAIGACIGHIYTKWPREGARGAVSAQGALEKLAGGEKARAAMEAGSLKRDAFFALVNEGYTPAQANAIIRDATRVRKG